MPPLRSTVTLLLVALGVCAGSQTVAASNTVDEVPPACPVTTPTNPSFVPSLSNPLQISRDRLWYGSDVLWIALPVSGVWTVGRYASGEPAFRQKLLSYRKGYNAIDAPNPPLMITGKRLDGPAPPLGVDGPHGAWVGEPRQQFMTTTFNIPATGCWRITGQYQLDKRTFVVWVQDSSAAGSSASDGKQA